MKAWHYKGLKLDVQLTPIESKPQTRGSHTALYWFGAYYTYTNLIYDEIERLKDKAIISYAIFKQH